MSSPTMSQEAAEAIFATAFPRREREVESLDPSEHLDFSRPSAIGISRFDTRTDRELRQAIFDHPIGMERERSIWEYADRNGAESLSALREAAHKDPDPTIRSTTLWAIQKFGGIQSVDTMTEFVRDDHPEVRDWACLLLREITGVVRYTPESRKAKLDEANPFDQTLPLQIAGYARVLVPQLGWVQATLSPQWFESILGRVMACTCENTFESKLVIEKRVSGYHPDGTDHFEIFKFGGFSQALSDDVYLHNFEALSRHTFYQSGKVEEVSSKAGPLDDVDVRVQRFAMTHRMNMPELENRRVVQSVRGRYMGPAYINLDRIMSNGMSIGAGEVQLSNLHHPVAGPLTNTFLFGTFKGKLSDLDGDGYLDVNTERCHGTLDGEPDFDLDGKPDCDPYDVLCNRS